MSDTRWPWLGALGGALGGALDFALFHWLAPDMGRWNTWALAGVFLLNMAALGFLLGHLYLARGRAQRDAVTIRAQLEALERSHHAAAQAEKLAALGRVAAGIAHEVRNPLGVIRSSASLIEEDLTEGQTEAKRACQFVVEEIDRMDRLVGGLLLFARPSPPRRGALHLRETVERTLQLCSSALSRRVAIASEVTPELPEIEGDPALIQQLLFGLVLNAAEAGARHVTLRAGQQGTNLIVDVLDDGPGVPADQAELIFEPFYTTKDSGTGLGLPTAARIATSHGGSLTLRECSPGACFRLSLPALPSEACG